MFRRVGLRLAAATTGFSSAAFTDDDGGAYERFQQERERLQRENTDYSAAGTTSESKTASSSTFSSSSWSAAEDDANAKKASYYDMKRPTIDTYRAMTDEELVELFHTREGQVKELRRIYESFHYDADKNFRTIVLDYHDKAAQLSQVHGKMQSASLQINREALTKMREEQEMLNRDKRLVLFLCSLFTLVFWIWVRRHYVHKQDLEASLDEFAAQAQRAPSVTGMGSYGGNWFSSVKRSARHRETTWEKEVRERREKEEATAAADGGAAGGSLSESSASAQPGKADVNAALSAKMAAMANKSKS